MFVTCVVCNIILIEYYNTSHKSIVLLHPYIRVGIYYYAIMTVGGIVTRYSIINLSMSEKRFARGVLQSCSHYDCDPRRSSYILYYIIELYYTESIQNPNGDDFCKIFIFYFFIRSFFIFFWITNSF